MTTITLTPDIETPLTERARQQGTTPELLALDGLRRLFAPGQVPPLEGPAGETLLDFLEGYVGTVDGASEALPTVAGGDDPRLRVLEEIESRTHAMNPQPDQRDYLREGRAGAMFGETSPGD